jgi:type III pantothenate kinase
MLLVMDVGNTNTVLGVYERARLRASWRITTRREQTADEYGVFIENLFQSAGLLPGDITAIALSSVVPTVQPVLEETASRYFGIAPFVVKPGVNVSLPMLIDNPRELGADRVVNAVAAIALYGAPVIIVDFGTATTFDAISPRGEFVGGAIAPGLEISSEALFQKGSQLYRVELSLPDRVIGTNTATAMQSGILYGYAGLVDGILERMFEELGGGPRVIATGGLASAIHKQSRRIDEVNTNLTLEGLRIIHERATA